MLNLRNRPERKQSTLMQLAKVMPLSKLRIFTADGGKVHQGRV